MFIQGDRKPSGPSNIAVSLSSCSTPVTSMSGQCTPRVDICQDRKEASPLVTSKAQKHPTETSGRFCSGSASLDQQDLSWNYKGRTQGAFSVLSYFEICKVENLQERKERESRAEDQNPRISHRKEEGTVRGGGWRKQGGGRWEHALTQLGFAFLQYLFFKIFFFFFFGADHFFSLY